MTDEFDKELTLEEKLDLARKMAIDLRILKAEEMRLRLEIVLELFKGKSIGTHKVSKHGFNIKVKLGVSHSLDQDEVANAIENGFYSEEELACIKTSYALKLKEYKQTTETPDLDEDIIVKSSAPTLTIELGED